MADAQRRILIADDDPTVTELVTYGLAKEGYAIDVTADGGEALALAMENPYDLYILDVMLPGMDGYSLCRSIRSFTTAPVLFLSARDSELDKVVGLEIGADDYLAKPIGLRELVARVRALLRRAANDLPRVQTAITVGGITLDQGAHTVEGDHGPIDLTPREFELLACLMRKAGKAVSREDLLREAWGWEILTETKTIETHIKRLRKKLEVAGYDVRIIETVRGRGYRMRGDN